MRKVNLVTDEQAVAGLKVGAFKGAIDGLENSKYHDLRAYWSSSDLKYLAKSSPKHFYRKYFGEGKNEQLRVTEDMTLGSLVHCLFLTPDHFEKEFFIIPELNLRTNDGRETKARLLAENPNKWPITEEMLSQAKKMVESLNSNYLIRKLMGDVSRERAFFWTCPFSNLDFKAKVDASCPEYFVELKTTANVSPDFMSKHIFDMNWDLSLAHYVEAMRQFFNVSPKAYFVCVEREAPFVTQVYRCGEMFLETGHAKWLDAVTKLANGIQKNSWPGYAADNEELEINPPAWAISKIMPKGNGDGV